MLMMKHLGLFQSIGGKILRILQIKSVLRKCKPDKYIMPFTRNFKLTERGCEKNARCNLVYYFLKKFVNILILFPPILD